MGRFVEGENRRQQTMLPACLEDYIAEDNPIRVVDAFVEELDLAALGFERVQPAATGRPSYHPATLLKIYLYGYLNRIQSSRRLEREAARNIELMRLTGRLAPDFKTIADFRKANGIAICAACARFIVICGQLGLFSHAVAAIDGAKFKGVNSRDRNFTRGKLKRRVEQVEASIERYLASLEAADLQEGENAEAKATRLRDKITAMKAKLAELTYIPEIVDADTAAYLLCISRSMYDKYVDLGILPEADVVFGNLKRWRWSTIVDHVTRHPSVALIGADAEQVDPYLKAIWDGAKATP